MQEDIVEPVVQQSQLMWLYSAMGLRYSLALPVAGLAAFVMTILLLVRGRGSAQIGGLIFLAALPFLVGLLGTVDALFSVYQTISLSNLTPKPSEMSEGIAMSMVTLFVGMILAAPSYVAATLGLSVRALIGTDGGQNYIPSDRTFPQMGK